MRHLTLILFALATACASPNPVRSLTIPPRLARAGIVPSPPEIATDAAARPALAVQNLGGYRQKGWVFVGAPGAQHMAGTCQPQGWRTVAAQGGLAVFVDLPGYGWENCSSIAPARTDTTLPPFSDWVFDEPERLKPRFQCGQYESEQLTITSVEMLTPRIRVGWRTRIPPPIDLTLEGWHDFWPGVDTCDISLQAIWGTVASTGMSAELPALTMTTGERAVIDIGERKSLPQGGWNGTDNTWTQLLATPRPWGRASRLQWTGALICTEKGREGWPWTPGWSWQEGFSERHDQLIARAHGPLCAVSGAWAGSWGALGELPQAPPNAAATTNAAWDQFWLYGWGATDEYAVRPLAQPKEAGTTGEQIDFGCSGGWDAAVQVQPWAVQDYAWQVQAHGLRPYSYREADGRPVREADHPRTVTYNLRPDNRLGPDILGLPRDVPYSWPGSGYGNADDQHRSENLLVADWLLRRNPCTGSVIRDEIQLDLMRYWPPSNAPIASPRGWGRPLLAWSHFDACGFTEAHPLITRAVDALWQGASYRRLPVQDAAHSVRVLSDNEGKYGWLKPGGTNPELDMIRSWLGWQEGVVAIGLEAAYRQTGDERARQMALTTSETIVRHSFYQHGGRWQTAYAVRWRTDDPGAPLPASSYWPSEGDNKDVFTYGIQRWMLASVRLVQVHGDVELRDRATQILAAFPVVDWRDSCWQAIGPQFVQQ